MFRTIAAASATAVLTIIGAHASTAHAPKVYNTQQCLDAKAAVARVQAALRNEATRIAEHNPGSLSTTVASNQATHDVGVASTAILAGVAGQTGC